MGRERISIETALLAIVAVCVLVTSAPVISQETVAYSFNASGKDAKFPFAGLIADADGNLYGTTVNGGTYNAGTAFELRPAAGGGWTEHVLHSFGGNNVIKDGGYPYAGLVLDASGNLYGTTVFGGAYNEGTVFELIRGAGETWSEKILHTFNNNGKDGNQPWSSLIFDSSGNLYGTTFQGGAYTRGTVFELMPTSGGVWTEKVLYAFNKNGRDGVNPYSNVIFDTSGNLYGTTGSQNKTYNFGTVFELVPTTGGGWTERILHSFKNDGTDGLYPHGGVIFDASGNLYGTMNTGTGFNGGGVFKLTPAASGAWTEAILYSFGGSTTDGASPYAGLIFDSAGNLYGTTFLGGAVGGGIVFELTPVASGSWNETILHTFDNRGTDGWGSYCGLIFRSDGNLYGTTSYGGAYGGGAVFEIAP
jgi:uncharacterized repeat protein (TIGR03803 family)